MYNDVNFIGDAAMSVSNSLRRLIKPELGVYSVRDTECYENDEVVIYTDDSVDICDVNEVDHPSRVLLSCSIDAKKASSSDIYPDQDGKNAAYESIALAYSGFGKLVMSNGKTYDFYGKRIDEFELNFDDVIFKRDFLLYENTKDPPDDTVDGVRLHAYGGRYYPGINLSEIEQTFFHVRNGNQGIVISDLEFWRSRGVDPATGGIVRGKSDTKLIGLQRDFERRSLGQLIRDGCISCTMIDDNEESIELRSTGYQQNGDSILLSFEDIS